MSQEERIVRAAWWLAVALFTLALPPKAPPPEPCARPAERTAHQGRTTDLFCDARPGAPPVRGPARRLVDLPIDPNRADPLTLETLPGVGPTRAAAIVRERTRRRFARVEDLLRVPGIGPVTLRRIAPLLEVMPPAGAGPDENR